jgi:hypothetical protein
MFDARGTEPGTLTQEMASSRRREFANSYAGLMLDLKLASLLSNSYKCTSVRDRGVGGSNPLAPTKNFNRVGPQLTVMVG